MEKQSSIVKGKTVKQVRKINLSNRGLTEIPADVFLHTNLTKLVLSRNTIKRIPKEIANLKKLEVLDLAYNQIDSLPAPVFKLPKLRVLSVGHNRIKKFPVQMVNSSIKELIADHNQITKMEPEAIDGLSRLLLNDNPIGGQLVTHLLPKLEYYDFRRTYLETPDAEFIPAVKKGWIPVHPAVITNQMRINKALIDAMMGKRKSSLLGPGGSIFISHSSNDKAIIQPFVDHILQLGIGIPREMIRCTSIQGMGIKNGEEMRKWIRKEIETCSLAFLMISPNYKDSEICLNEMGAIWALNKPVKILLLPGVEYNNFGWLEEIRQAGHIEDDGALNQIYDDLTEQFELKKIATVWGNHKSQFIEICKNAMLMSEAKLTQIHKEEDSEVRYKAEELMVFSKWANSGGSTFIASYTKDGIAYYLGAGNSYVVEPGQQEAEWDDFFGRLEEDRYIKVAGYDSYGHARYKITKAGFLFVKSLEIIEGGQGTANVDD